MTSRFKFKVRGGIWILVFVIVAGLNLRSAAENENPANPAIAHETIFYRINKFGVGVGQAQLTISGKTQFEGQEYFLIEFSAKAMNFLDEEKIYADLTSLMPVKVVRNLNIFGRKENIEENYRTVQGGVEIIKHANGQDTRQVINKKDALDNIYCFIQRYRQEGNFQKGDQRLINLPTREVKIICDGTVKLKVLGNMQSTSVMRSQPRQYQIWFSQESSRIPLRIDGALGLGHASLVMSRYENKAEK